MSLFGWFLESLVYKTEVYGVLGFYYATCGDFVGVWTRLWALPDLEMNTPGSVGAF